MKKKLLVLFSGALLALGSLTSCQLPSAPSPQDVGSSNTSQSETSNSTDKSEVSSEKSETENNDHHDDDKEDIDDINDLVNNSLKVLNKRLTLPMLHFDGAFGTKILLEGNYIDERHNYQDGSTSKIKESEFMQSEDIDASLKGDVDNLYYLASKDGDAASLHNRSNYIIDVTDSTNNDRSGVWTNNFNFKVLGNNIISRYNNGEEQNPDPENFNITVGQSLDMAYTATCQEYDIKLSTIALAVLAGDTSRYGFEVADAITAVDRILRYMDGDIKDEEFLDILLTRVLHIDKEKLTDKEKTGIMTGLNVLKNFDLNEIFVVNKTGNRYDVKLDYQKVLSFVKTVRAAVFGIQATISEVYAEKVRKIYTFLDNLLAAMPTNVIINGTIDEKADIITAVHVNFDITSPCLNTVYQTVKYPTEQEDYYINRTYTYTHLKGLANVKLDFKDNYISPLK